jgi:NTE family protein
MLSFRAVLWVLVLLISIGAQSPVGFARTKDDGARSGKIGLVLSGGGALGVAHIGVLKALEELHIPIDCIAGTSMGSVVGGLYASGMSPAEIEHWFRRADWHFLLSDTLPRESLSFEEKQRQYDMNQGIAFNVSTRKGTSLPAGFIRGRNIMGSLREMTLPARNITDFDRLPIPFRAVATDIETGEMVVLKDGDLVDAIRASLSIPAMFVPHVVGSRRLADGGMTSNLPVHVAQEMGADVIIAVDVSEPLAKGDDLNTAVTMANQVINIFIREQTARETARLGPADALLRIKITGLTSTDFVNAARAIDEGHDQAMENRGSLARFSVDGPEYQAFLARQRRARVEPILISHIRVKTPEGEYEHPLKHPLQFTTGDQERFTKVQNVIGDTGEMQKYEVGDFEFFGDAQDGYGLLVKAQKKKTGDNDLSVGFGIDYSTTDDSDLSLRLAYRMTELNSLGAQWRTYLSLGDTTVLNTEWYQPIDWDRRFFVAIYGLLGSDWIDGRDAGDDPLRFRLQDHAAGLDVGARLWQWGELRLGYGRGISRISRRLGVPDEVPTKIDRGWLHADLTFDTLDAATFATKGNYGRVSFISSREEFGASDNYNRLEGQYFHPITFGKKNTILPRVAAQVKLGGGLVPIYDQAELGGLFNLSGLSRGTLYGENTALAELIYYREFGQLTPGFGRRIYGGFSLEAGQVWSDSSDFDLSETVFAGSIFVGANTSIGALLLGVGFAEGGDAAIYLQLGSPFGQGRDQR